MEKGTINKLYEGLAISAVNQQNKPDRLFVNNTDVLIKAIENQTGKKVKVEKKYKGFGSLLGMEVHIDASLPSDIAELRSSDGHRIRIHL